MNSERVQPAGRPLIAGIEESAPNSNGQTGQIIRPQKDRWPPERGTSPETGSQHLLASFVQIPVGVRSFDDEPPIPAQGRPSYAPNRSEIGRASCRERVCQ